MIISPKVRQVVKWVGYPTAYLAMFGMFAYCSFPYGRLKQRLEAGFNAAQQTSPDASRLQIGEATWSWNFPGVVLEDIDLIPPLVAATASGEAPERPTVHADKVSARIAPLSMLFGTTDVTYDVDGFGGAISGTLTVSAESKHLVAEFEGVDPGQLPGVRESLELPLSGVMTGKIDLRLPEGKISAAEGVVDIEISDLKIGDGKTKIRGLFALPTLDAGTMKLKATATQGKVKIEQFETKGADLEASGEGRIRLRDTLALSMIEQLSLNYKFSDKYRDKDDTTRSLLGKPGDSAPALMDLDPKVKRAKQADDSYAWRVSGSLTRLTFTPALGTSKPGAAGASRTRPGAAH
jgi:type II secretion system protein N